MMKIKEIWFEDDYLYGRNEDGKVYRQSLLWYPHLRKANEEERNKYRFGLDGIHWRDLDEDVSFESFGYEDAEPSKLQRFFLTHTEINVSEIAKRVGVSATLLRNYINGFKKPSREQEMQILNQIHHLSEEHAQVAF